VHCFPSWVCIKIKYKTCDVNTSITCSVKFRDLGDEECKIMDLATLGSQTFPSSSYLVHETRPHNLLNCLHRMDCNLLLIPIYFLQIKCSFMLMTFLKINVSGVKRKKKMKKRVVSKSRVLHFGEKNE